MNQPSGKGKPGRGNAGKSELSPVQRALLEQRKLRAQLDEAAAQIRAPIAVIGLGCRFPGASSPAAFWELLRDGTDAIVEMPTDRWDTEALYDPDPHAPGKIATRWGGFVDDIDAFDAQFFGISRREAAGMDPQQRLLLEVAWEAIEHAGQAAVAAGSQTGVFVGLGSSDYAQLEARQLSLDQLNAYTSTGYSHSVASGRISYAFGLHGPAVSVDTACSSSLVAIHLACQALRSGECRMALAGGVNAILGLENSVSLSKAQMMAPDGRCKAFDASADGFVRAEGCGIVILKRLAHAEADGDRVLAVIRGSAVNQDGRSTGLTVPNGPAQEDVLRRALEGARVDPADVSYVEAHGTGTVLGDPIELQALGEVLGRERPADRPVRVGSVKTNVGHLESAAGVCGLIKVVLSLVNEEIPRSLHFSDPNPHIEWSRYPFLEVPRVSVDWSGQERVAGVSSFGFGGTNAHVVLAAAPPQSAISEETDRGRPACVLPISARTESALDALAAQHRAVLPADDDSVGPDFSDICYTAGVGRRHFEHRLAIRATSAREAARLLDEYIGGKDVGGLASGSHRTGESRRVGFLFTGQGAQSEGMGRALYESEPTFRRTFDQCAELLSDVMDRGSLDVLHGDAGLDSLRDTIYAQPALFALEYSLSEMWRSWGVEPSVVMGHSVGELVAACVAGVFDLEAGLRIVAERGRLMGSLPLGGMMSVILSDHDSVVAELESFPEVTVAGVNGPANVVISGPVDSVEALLGRFDARGIESRALKISNSFHSSTVDPILDEFEDFVAGFDLREPRLPIVSNLTGELALASEITTPRYWRKHLRQPVLFSQGVQALVETGATVFLEVGPHPTLTTLGQQCVEPGRGTWMASLRRDKADWDQVLETVSRLYVEGIDIDWHSFASDRVGRVVDLPTYPFQRSRYWFTAEREPEMLRDEAREWKRIVEAATLQSRQVPIDLDLASYVARWDALDRLTTKCIVDTLRSLGAYAGPGEAHTPSELADLIGAPGKRSELIELWLERLTEEGLLQRDGASFVAPEPLEDPGLSDCWIEVDERLEDLPILRDYLRRCADGLPDFITGRASVIDALFPEGSFETAEFLYGEWALPRYFNGVLSSAAAAHLQSVSGRRPSVVEVGAGSGGATSVILPRLPDGVAEYWFTDVSDHFLKRATRRFADYEFMRFARLDAESDPASQGFEERSFDIVVAANSIHTTRDPVQALDHCRRLLRPGGLLLIYEVTRELSWLSISFALFDGWRRHESELVGDGTLLTTDAWEKALRSIGFKDVSVLPEAGSAAEVLGHHAIIARLGEGAQSPGRAISRGGVNEPVSPDEISLESTPSQAVPEGDGGKRRRGLAVRLASAPVSDHARLAAEFVRVHVMDVLDLEADETPDRKDRLMDLGFDSLTAVELKGRLFKSLDGAVELPATLIFDYPTIEAIADLIRSQVAPASASSAAASDGSAGASESSNSDADREETEIDELSEEQVERLLLEKLGEL